MKTFFLIILMFLPGISFCQETGYPRQSYKIDTLILKKDTSRFFIQDFWDTTVVKSYFCSVDSIDKTIRYGFLHLKKRRCREYRFVNLHDVKLYDVPEKYSGYRGQHLSHVILKFLE